MMRRQWKAWVTSFIGGLGIMILVSACSGLSQRPADSLYQDLGQQTGIAQLVDAFIVEIGYTRSVLHHFSDTDLDRFRQKLIEQLCMLSGGPCEYTGDSMLQVHQGMHITEAEFNAVVDALIRAMEKTNIAYPVQNRLLAELVPMRGEIIYR